MRSIYLLILVLLIGQTAYGQEVLRLSEEACVARALEQNHGLKAAHAYVEGAHAAFRSVRANRLFQVQSRASFLRFSPNIPDFRIAFPTPAGIREQVIAPAILNRYALQLEVLQPIFTGGALKHTERATHFQAQAAEAQYEDAAVELAYRVREAFWGLYEAEHILQAKEHAVKHLEAQLEDVEHFMAQGLAAEQHLLAVRAQLAQARSERLTAAYAVEQARVALNRLLGLPPEQDVVLQADTSVLRPVMDVELRHVVAGRPEVRQLQARLKSAEARKDVARAAFFPQVYVKGTVDYARPNPYIFPLEDRFEATWNVGVLVTLPLWKWGQRVSDVERARSQVQALREQLADLREQVRMEVVQQKLRMEQMYAGIGAAREALLAAQKTFEVARARYREGLALNSEVLEAEAMLRKTEAAYHHAIAAFKRAEAQWKRTLGRIR